MSAPPTDQATLTDEQLQIFVAYLGRACLEIERGLRPLDQIRRFADPRRPSRLASEVKVGRFRGGPVQREDVGPPMVSRLSRDHAVATVVTRTEGARWGAITLDLRAVNGRWYVAGLERILAASHYRSMPADRQTRRAL